MTCTFMDQTSEFEPLTYALRVRCPLMNGLDFSNLKKETIIPRPVVFDLSLGLYDPTNYDRWFITTPESTEP